MKISENNFNSAARSYINVLQTGFTESIILKVENLAHELLKAWKERRNVYICGNGGSAANALHIANDLHYGIGTKSASSKISGIRVEALPGNVGILTCLANDTGYENIYSHQLEVKSNANDLLIVLSGSGNSPNIVNALKKAKELKVKSFAIVAFSGGKSAEIADEVIHFPISDMQIAEDTQLIIGHLCMQWLSANNTFILNKNDRN